MYGFSAINMLNYQRTDLFSFELLKKVECVSATDKDIVIFH